MHTLSFSPATCAYPFIHKGHGAAEVQASSMSGSLGVADTMHTAEHGAVIAAVQQGCGSIFQPLVMAYAQSYSGDAGDVIQSVATAYGGSYTPSFHSLELPAATPPPQYQSDFYAAAAAVQANDYYYYSSQPRYAESPLTLAELYSASVGSASPVLGYGPTTSITGISGCGYMDEATGSVLSSVSFSGSRFPQWYLPRGYCPMPCANVVGDSCSSAYAPYADCASTGITPTTLSMGPNSTQEEMLSSQDGRLHYAVMPQPPRLAPQPTFGTLTPFALPPSYAAASAGNDGHVIGVRPTSPSGMRESSSSASLPITSPASRAARTPQFLPYDGRAYGIPPCKAQISSADAAASVEQCLLITSTQGGGYSSADAVQPICVSVRKPGPLHPMPVYPLQTSPFIPHALPHNHWVSTGDTGAVSESAERYCSPEESALLADVRARLAQQHRSSQLLKQRALTQRAGLKPLSRADFVVLAKVPASGKKVGVRSTSHDSASLSIMTAEEATVARLSPIPQIPTVGDIDAEASDQSVWDGADAAVQAPTQDALDRVLTVPGVLWRHDPYSRNVLPQAQATVESDSSGTTSTSYFSLPSSPHVARAALGFSDRGDATASVTQPPRSTDISARTNGSSSDSADGMRPSTRRLPTKKVCVRHYVSPDGDSSLSHERSGAVGTLLSVREASSAAVPMTLCADGASILQRHSAFVDDDDEGPAPTIPPEIAPAAVLTATAPVHAKHRKLPVPKPRSKQMRLSSWTRGKKVGIPNEHSGAPTAASSSVSSASGGLEASHLNSPSGLAVVAPTEGHGSADTSAASSAAAVLTDPAASAMARPEVHRPGAYSSPLDIRTRLSAYQPASRWAWRLRSSRVYPLPQPAEMDTAENDVLVDTLADLDTSCLARLWRNLDLSGCFRDALERRRRVIGPGSNSSIRVLNRMIPLTRRLMNRRRGLEAGKGNGRCFTVLRESEMKYVCLLQHRFRRSTAVAAEHYAPGTMVVVDGDMGIDTGVVKLSMTRNEYEAMTDAQRRAAHLVVHLEFALASSIHRAAHADEVLVHNNTQAPLEESTLDFLQYLTTQPHLFQSCRVEWMRFVDVEFQADGQKLYVHYTCDTPVRFIELATFLNHIFHCRIWMKMLRTDERQVGDGVCSTRLSRVPLTPPP
ncbi:PSP1 Cterminal conserved region containing protein [Leishmania braziliensis]|nr:PSP1 Cterminal conserved region containing protein [Leishmania braziliensis]